MTKSLVYNMCRPAHMSKHVTLHECQLHTDIQITRLNLCKEIGFTMTQVLCTSLRRAAGATTTHIHTHPHRVVSHGTGADDEGLER